MTNVIKNVPVPYSYLEQSLFGLTYCAKVQKFQIDLVTMFFYDKKREGSNDEDET